MKKFLTLWAFICSFSSFISAASSNVIIYEVYGGGGNSGAVYDYDYVVLYNMSTSSVDLTNWSVQYTTSTGTGAWDVTNLSGSIAAKGFYLIRQGRGTGTAGAALPTPDVIRSTNLNMSAVDGKIAIRNSTVAFSGITPTGAIDFLGYGAANTYEGTQAAPALDNTKAANRNAVADTDQNNVDFIKQTPAPKNALSAPLPVVLSKMEVKVFQNQNILTWKTDSEINSEYFEIQHSSDGIEFNSIGQIKSVGSFSNGAIYNFEHSSPSVGINYYRFKQVDIDGKTDFSKVISVIFGNKSKITIAPVVAKESVILYTSSEEILTYNVYNLAGQQVFSNSFTAQDRIDISQLQVGMYFIHTSKGDIARFVKQ